MPDVSPTEAAQTYEVEAAFEAAMPTRELTLREAREWLEELCRAEDLDTPDLQVARLKPAFEAAALPDEWCLLVANMAPTQHTLLHELSHLACANRGHGREFRTQLVRYLRRWVSVDHAADLHARFMSAGLSVDPFAATR
ncbi:MAG: hypothetical protein EBU67_04850 [Actinobacteria bacterium]|nr:hypothetical protein [Actinomycetota bacterium]NBP53612.1 hypothetical protein [Actinomycetota bacterium]